jgi:hypothetical protein
LATSRIFKNKSIFYIYKREERGRRERERERERESNFCANPLKNDLFLTFALEYTYSLGLKLYPGSFI